MSHDELIDLCQDALMSTPEGNPHVRKALTALADYRIAQRSLPPQGSDGRVERGTAHAALPANVDPATDAQRESDRGDAHIARTHAPKGSIG